MKDPAESVLAGVSNLFNRSQLYRLAKVIISFKWDILLVSPGRHFVVVGRAEVVSRLGRDVEARVGRLVGRRVSCRVALRVVAQVRVAKRQLRLEGVVVERRPGGHQAVDATTPIDELKY